MTIYDDGAPPVIIRRREKTNPRTWCEKVIPAKKLPEEQFDLHHYPDAAERGFGGAETNEVNIGYPELKIR